MRKALILALAVVLFSFLPSSAVADTTPEQALLGLLNDHRAEHGLAPLHFSVSLNLVAHWKAIDMAVGNYFSHTDSLQRNPFQRMADFGYNYNVWKGENLAAGSKTPQVAFQLWRDSPGHNANLLNAHFVVVGLARAYSPDSSYGWYWAAEFGGHDDRPWWLQFAWASLKLRLNLR